jgi:uncharacterized protein
MEINENADLDTSQIDDQRGSGGGGGGGGLGGLIPIPMGGGGGKIGLIITVVVVLGMLLLGGTFGRGMLGGGDSGSSQGDNASLEKNCGKDNPDRFKRQDCRNVLYVNSIQSYWQAALPQVFGKPYEPAKTVFFSQAVSTGCGQADSGVGPFYCPADSQVYIDLTFYNELSSRFGAKGEFAAPYVIAHEYGHHIQNLLGTNAKVQQGDTGPTSGSVRLELQADCYAGTWAFHATETKDKEGDAVLFKSITQQDIDEALEAAQAIGDDTIQKKSGSGVNPDAFTHGTSAQRQKWFTIGFDKGDPKLCDTFSTSSL